MHDEADGAFGTGLINLPTEGSMHNVITQIYVFQDEQTERGPEIGCVIDPATQRVEDVVDDVHPRTLLTQSDKCSPPTAFMEKYRA